MFNLIAGSTTFKQFLPVYRLDALDPAAALGRLYQTRLDVAVLLEGLSEIGLSQPPEDDGWAIRNTESHLQDAQGVASFRLSFILEQESNVPESKAVFEWAMKEEEHLHTTQETFDSYQASRQENIAKSECIPQRDKWRSGQHEEFNAITLRQ